MGLECAGGIPGWLSAGCSVECEDEAAAGLRGVWFRHSDFGEEGVEVASWSGVWGAILAEIGGALIGHEDLLLRGSGGGVGGGFVGALSPLCRGGLGILFGLFLFPS